MLLSTSSVFAANITEQNRIDEPEVYVKNGEAFTDWKFNVIVDMRQFNFGGMGSSAQGIRILFFDFDNSTKSFKYTLTDTNSPLNN